MNVRRTIALLVLACAVFLSAALWRGIVASVSDFTSYWIAGQQLIQHRNPYDAARALEVERSMGFTAPRPLVMRNPPWALWVTLPIGVLTYSVARLLWSLCLIAMLWYSASALWTIYRGMPGRSWLPVLLTFSFAPTLACLSVGQTAPFVLLGIVVFMQLHSRHQFWAGFALILAAFKPQIAFLFWITLLLWCLQFRKWKLIIGVVSGIGLATVIASAFDPHLIDHYRNMLVAESIEIQLIPTFGGLLRQLLGSAWWQVVPAIAGVAATVVYYCRFHRHGWRWEQHMPVLALASMLLTPYGWLGDEVLVLCALIPAAEAIGQRNQRLSLFALPFVWVNLAILTLLTVGVRVNTYWYVWTIWVWALFYALARPKWHEIPTNAI